MSSLLCRAEMCLEYVSHQQGVITQTLQVMSLFSSLTFNRVSEFKPGLLIILHVNQHKIHQGHTNTLSSLSSQPPP